MKIHNKIIYLLISVFVIYTLLFSGFIYYSISNYAFTDFYKRLEIRAAILAKLNLENPNDLASIQEMHEEYLEQLPNQKDYALKLPANTQTIRESGIPKVLIEQLLAGQEGKYRNQNIFYSGIKYAPKRGGEYIVAVSAENYFHSHHIAYLRNLLLTTLAYAILLIILSSLLISRTLIKPIQKIITDVKNISSENLNMRLETPKQNDSLGKLIMTFNDMLNRLETAFESQKNFISNASHELNTPLTSIIGEADFALSKDRSSEEYKAILENILNEAEKLDKKTKALLLLARTGFDGKSQKFGMVRMDQLIMDVKETVQKISPQAQISIDFSLLPENPERLKIKGNEQLLHLALSNIVVNACKYSNYQPVHIALGATDKEVVVIIRDTGIGIPLQEKQYIYDPYFRASNTHSYEGYGIGLPLSRNIIQMHQGKLIVESEVNKGTVVQIQFSIGQF